LSTRITPGYADWDEGNLSQFLVAAQSTYKIGTLQNGYHPGNAIIDHAGRFWAITSELLTIQKLSHSVNSKAVWHLQRLRLPPDPEDANRYTFLDPLARA
jgi:hypothetical protein